MKKFYLVINLVVCSFILVSAQKSAFSPKDKSDGWRTAEILHNKENIVKMDTLISKGHFKQISSVLIAQNGKLIFEGYCNKSNQTTLHNTRSATKTITGILIGCLINDKLLRSEKEYASKYSRRDDIYYPDARKDNITIEDLLTMSSILECDDWHRLSRGNEERMYLLEDWVKFYWDLPIKGYPEWKTPPEESEFGRDFSYCTAGTVVLGDIINNVTGNLQNYADKVLFDKLGITQKHWQIIPIGIPMTGGGLGLSSRDLLKIGQLYLNKGKWNDEQIIPENWVYKSITPKAKMPEEYGGAEYGYLWWISNFSNEKAYYMAGSGGNKIAVFPELDLVVVLTSTFYNGGYESHLQTSKLLSEYIVPEIQKIF